MAELLLDPNIRGWVFLPIVVITFLVGIIRHYVSILLASQKKVELHQVQDSQVMIRSRLLRENGQYIPKMAFISRRHFFNNEETGYFKTQKRAPVSQNPITDPNVMIDMLKGNVTNVLPTVLIGGWINWMLSGFVTTKVPFPLTLRFKPMLQRGIELITLDAAWVSSASWYFLNVFGLRFNASNFSNFRCMVISHESSVEASSDLCHRLVKVMFHAKTGEGSKPIFERKEINGVLTNVEEVEEHRTVFTVKNDTLEGKFKKRWTSLSPIRNSSRCILSRHSRDERYNREYRERSRERSQDRGKDRSREQRVTLPHYCGHIPVPMYYSHFLPRLIMMTPLMSIRGQIPRGTNRFSPIRRSVQRLLPRIVPPCMHRLPFNPNHYRSKNF